MKHCIYLIFAIFFALNLAAKPITPGYYFIFHVESVDELPVHYHFYDDATGIALVRDGSERDLPGSVHHLSDSSDFLGLSSFLSTDFCQLSQRDQITRLSRMLAGIEDSLAGVSTWGDWGKIYAFFAATTLGISFLILQYP